MPREPRSAKKSHIKTPSIFNTNRRRPSGGTSPQSPSSSWGWRSWRKHSRGEDSTAPKGEPSDERRPASFRYFEDLDPDYVAESLSPRGHEEATPGGSHASSRRGSLASAFRERSSVFLFSSPSPGCFSLIPDVLPLRRVAWPFPSFEFIHSPSCKARAHADSESHQ